MSHIRHRVSPFRVAKWLCLFGSRSIDDIGVLVQRAQTAPLGDATLLRLDAGVNSFLMQKNHEHKPDVTDIDRSVAPSQVHTLVVLVDPLGDCIK